MKKKKRTDREYAGRMNELFEQLEDISPENRRSILSILDMIGEGIRIVDPQFRIIYENRIHRDLLGEHVGEYCYKAYQQKDSICEGCTVAQSFSDGKVRKEVRSVKTDDDLRFIEVTASTIRDAQGHIIAGVEVVADVTDRKKMEKERENLIAELQEALHKIKTLKGLIPVCAWCKKARDDRGYWDNLENYIREHSEADFTHGICPECLEKADAEIYGELMEKKSNESFNKEKDQGNL
jgi:PAS domain S-box-containing protein